MFLISRSRKPFIRKLTHERIDIADWPLLLPKEFITIRLRLYDHYNNNHSRALDAKENKTKSSMFSKFGIVQILMPSLKTETAFQSNDATSQAKPKVVDP